MKTYGNSWKRRNFIFGVDGQRFENEGSMGQMYSNSSHQCFIASIPHVNSSRLYDNVILTTAEIATTPSDHQCCSPLLVRGRPRREG